MAILITRPGKNALYVQNPVMTAAGSFGWGQTYRGLVEIDKLGAIVTNPITVQPWSPASGTRVVPLPGGVLVHTGLPNRGLRRVLKEFSTVWSSLPVPVIAHLVATDAAEVRSAAVELDHAESVAGIELGLPDDLEWQAASDLVRAATQGAPEKPVIVRLPAGDALAIAAAVADAGADALVVAAPPRGIARDRQSGQLVRGRVYGPLVKPIALHLLATLHETLRGIPLIGAGGIHDPQDARDFIEAGAVAVQIDSLLWTQPNRINRIARDLGGGIVTRRMDAFPDEWHADMGDTEFRRRFGDE